MPLEVQQDDRTFLGTNLLVNIGMTWEGNMGFLHRNWAKCNGLTPALAIKLE